MRSPFGILLLAGIFVTSVLYSPTWPNQVDQATLMRRFRAAQDEYVQKMNGGYDMLEVNDLSMKLQIAQEDGDRPRFIKLLAEVEEALSRVVPRADRAKPATPEIQDGIDDPKIGSRFWHLRSRLLELMAAGYNLSEVNPLIPSLQQARKKKDWQCFAKLLDQIETGLARATPPPGSVNRAMEASWGPARRVDNFRFGIEFARRGAASHFSQIMADWVKVFVFWWRIELEPPQNGKHTYDWKSLDQLVCEYQTESFTNIQFVVHSVSPWGSRMRTRGAPSAASLPKKEHWADYEHFIRSLVERYDGDGQDDMPGLKAPVRYLEVESEVHHKGYWQGTAQEYGTLLKRVYKVAKMANPDCQIILAGLNLNGLFDDFPDQALLGARLRRLPPNMWISRAYRFQEEILTFNAWFDVVEFHYLCDYKGVYGTVDWIRTQMNKNGYDKPIWAGDAVAAPMMDGIFVSPFTRYQADEIFRILNDNSDPKHPETVLWYEREQAAALVKKFVAGMHTGLAGINMGNLFDWYCYWGGRDFTFQGLRREGGTPRPAFHAYRLFMEKAADTKRVERLRTSRNVYAYCLTRDDGPLFVLWCDRGKDTIRLPVKVPSVSLTATLVETTSGVASVQTLNVDQGKVTLELTSMPILIEPVLQ